MKALILSPALFLIPLLANAQYLPNTEVGDVIVRPFDRYNTPVFLIGGLRIPVPTTVGHAGMMTAASYRPTFSARSALLRPLDENLTGLSQHASIGLRPMPNSPKNQKDRSMRNRIAGCSGRWSVTR